LHLSASELGWQFGLQTVTTLMVRPGIGLLSNRIGRRAVIASGLTICSAAVFALSLATTLSSVIVVIVRYAAGVAITTAATSAYITDLTRRARYGAAHGVFGTIYDIGDAVGPISAGILVARLGYAQMFQVWRLSRDGGHRFCGHHSEALISRMTRANSEGTITISLRASVNPSLMMHRPSSGRTQMLTNRPTRRETSPERKT
jgi:MFS family permease